MADRVVFRLWTITDYEKEEQFLKDQHRKGWKFTRYLIPGFYLFDRCEPGEVVYRVDFDNAAEREKSEYLQMYRDYGWEYVSEANRFRFFRKPADSTEKKENEIFSDDESKLEMIDRIFRRRMIPFLCVFLFCLLPQLFIQYMMWLEYGRIAQKVLTVIFCVLFVLYMWLFIHCGRGIRRLKRKYKKCGP